ncbi:Gfo/Idh/MocA family protein [Aneurinibacillus thermoaerophilus]|uniref:Gfo/Idh/MocA family oxidoreductase n=1 Tax=Aneurinibacillus thermoaerophilus TaxID=143495 RepID=A0ABX8YC22_ANETH|nr:Gfo/Idh/MocA family oxidoreductase [Aneurinibacillus thermoaerophilus]QYY42553.1 Gfo/Idh/MocA family oxidoreductase [Aneurinibacillus thermoaerophilus]
MIRFAIVGCGHIAKKHIEAIRSINHAELVAFCDNNPARLEEFKDTYKIKGYLSLEEMLENEPQIDAVNICVPSGLHANLAIKAASYGKHIIVEKPIALTIEDADSIIEACEKNNVKLTVVHPNRFRPAVIALKEAMDNNLFGKISHANATVRWNRNQAYYDQAAWRGTKDMDGGVLMNQAIHNLDLLLWLVGPVEEVQAYTATRLRNIEAEDVAVATLIFSNGALGVIEAASTIYPKNYEESLSIFGETGSAVIGGTTANWIKHWVFEEVDETDAVALIEKINLDPYGISGHQQIITDFVEAIQQNRSPKVTGEDGKNALKLVLAIYEASERKKPVKLKHL